MYIEGLTNNELGKVWWDAKTYHDKGYFDSNGVHQTTETNFRSFYPDNIPNWKNAPRTGRAIAYCNYDGLACRDEHAGKYGEYYFEKEVLPPNNWYPTQWSQSDVEQFITNVTPFSRLDMRRRWNIHATLSALNDRNRVGLTIRIAHNGMAWRAYYDVDGNLISDGTRTGSGRFVKIVYLESMDGGMRDSNVTNPDHNYVEFDGNRTDFRFQLYNYVGNQYVEDDHYFEGNIT